MAPTKKTAMKVLFVTLGSCLIINQTHGLPTKIGPQTQVQADNGGLLPNGIQGCLVPVKSVGPKLTGTVSGLTGKVKDLTGQVGGETHGISNSCSDTVGKVSAGGFDIVGDSYGQANKGVGSCVNGIGNKGLETGSEVRELTGQVVGGASDSGKNLCNGVSGFTGEVGNAGVDSSNGVLGGITGVLDLKKGVLGSVLGGKDGGGGLGSVLGGKNGGCLGSVGGIIGQESDSGGGLGGIGGLGSIVDKNLAVVKGLTGGVLGGGSCGSSQVGYNGDIPGVNVHGKVNQPGGYGRSCN